MKKIILLASLAFSINAFAQVPNYVPSNGLVGWWPFNGNANDESGNNWNGTLNGPTLTPDRFGNLNKAFGFNGTSDFIQTNQVGPLGANSRAISFWAKTNQLYSSAQNEGMDVFCYGTDATGEYFELSLNHACEGLTVDLYNGVNTKSTTTTDNNWHHYIINFNNSNGTNFNAIEYWQDGTLLNSTCNQGNLVNINTGSAFNATIGRFFNTSVRFFKGTLDDIGIWNRVLTQQEITDLYNGNICYTNITVTDTLLINTNITGFNPVTYRNTIKVWPNPTNDHITIDNGNIANLTGYQIKITNSLSQQVFQSAITQQQFYVDLSTWTGNGIYFVHIIDGQGNTIDIKKIVLQ